MVEDVEEIERETEAHSFSDLRLFAQRQIQLPFRESAQNPAPCAAILAEQRGPEALERLFRVAEQVATRRVGAGVVRPGDARVIACADSGRRYRARAIAEDHRAAESLAREVLRHLKRLAAFRPEDARKIPAADQPAQLFARAEAPACAERQIVNPVGVELVPPIIK